MRCMNRRMRTLLLVAALAVGSAGTPAFAGAGDFEIVNETGAGLSAVSIRRFGTDQWKDLTATPSPGSRAPVAFKDEDCAFDIRAKVAGKDEVVWSGINLCGAKAVRLNRNASGAAWVDYD